MKKLPEEMENKYYVYAYLDPRKPGRYQYPGLDFSFLYEPFYIGKGKNNRDTQHLAESKRASTKKRNLYKNNKISSVVKSGLEPIIIRIYKDLSEDSSLNMEIFIISKIGRADIKTGPLTNHTNGGDGIRGYIFTDEVKAKMSKSQKDSPNQSARGKTLSSEQKSILRLSKIGSNNPMYGKTPKNKNKTLEELYDSEKAEQIRQKLIVSHIGHKPSEETRRKMSLSRTDKKMAGNFRGQPKTFKFINPDGVEFVVAGKFDIFCKENGLPLHKFKRMVQGRRKNDWNGWSVFRIG